MRGEKPAVGCRAPRACRLAPCALALSVLLATLAGCSTVAPAMVGTGIGTIPGDTEAGTLIEIETSALYEIF